MVSSTYDVESWYTERKKEFRTFSLLLRPDKNMNKSDSEKAAIAEQYSLCQIKMDKATEAFEFFNKQGFPGNWSGITAYEKMQPNHCFLGDQDCL